MAGAYRPRACPFAPAQLELLMACADLGTVDTTVVAAALNCRTETIHNRFSQILSDHLLSSRAEAIMLAHMDGWITLPRNESAPDGQCVQMPDDFGKSRNRRPWDCPFTAAHLELLTACVNLVTVNTNVLARALNRTPGTIHNRFSRLLRVHRLVGRAEAIMLAHKEGWVTVPRIGQTLNKTGNRAGSES